MLTPSKNNWLFFNPSECILCKGKCESSRRICSRCITDLPWLQYSCQVCALPVQANVTICAECQRQTRDFDQIACPFSYTFPISELIPAMKYKNHSDYLSAVCQATLDFFNKQDKPNCLIPIPMHPEKLTNRQYNHAWLIARQLGKNLGIEVRSDLLIKRVNTVSQAGLHARERKRNLRNSFTCSEYLPAYIAVIDDVVTTSATATEVSRLLKRNSCQRVDIWALARTTRKPSRKR